MSTLVRTPSPLHAGHAPYGELNENEFGEGFIAHELQEIIPYAVCGIKDAVNEDGTYKLQQVDYSKLVPTLVKAIQELNEKLVKNNIN